MSDLFEDKASASSEVSKAPKAADNVKAKPAKSGNYDASEIEVLEGLEPVRLRPGMYIGGTDSNAYHHLAAEIIDNSMDEAVAGFATTIKVHLLGPHSLFVEDNGRGIPVDPHPKFPDKSALEVILTTLHAGGKFKQGAYQTSGGLHGVGSSVVNALASELDVEVLRDGKRYSQKFSQGKPVTKLEVIGSVAKKVHGTIIRFTPDPEIFGTKIAFSPKRLFELCKNKAALFKGVTIEWKCAPELLGVSDKNSEETASEDTNEEAGKTELPAPVEAILHFPNGLADALQTDIDGVASLLTPIWDGEAKLVPDPHKPDSGKMEWALAFCESGGSFIKSYCNTIPTPLGGTHESGLRSAILKGFRQWGANQKIRKSNVITAEDIFAHVAAQLSVFIGSPLFQGQTKDKLSNPEVSRRVENTLRDRLDHWLASDPTRADQLTAFFVERAEERLRRREKQDVDRKSATKRLRLPGKLTDCTTNKREDSEIFLVEGESAGGSARQARSRETQAILPLRGKILNVASATEDKLRGNQELKDLGEALGCGMGSDFNIEKLRYGRIIIMTDADVDGAHIASLLMTFFYQFMRPLIEHGRLYLAQPPLYRLTHGANTVYAMNDEDREEKLKKDFKANAKVEISRFKGLGEMPMKDLKRTTMDPKYRTLLRVTIPEEQRLPIRQRVEDLMGRKPEPRFLFITEHANEVEDVDI